MDRSKVQKRINNLEKIRGIVEIAKFDTLQKLATSEKIKKYHYDIANVSRRVIGFSKNEFNISNKLLKGFKKKKDSSDTKRKLFIYITIESDLLTVPYEKLERLLDQEFNKSNDKLITVGAPAQRYGIKHRIEVPFHWDTLNEGVFDLVALIINMLTTGEIDEIYVMSTAAKVLDKSYKIFPVDVNAQDREKYYKTMKKLKFFYSLTEVIDTVSNSYFENIIEGMFQESYREFYKEKLVRHESSLTTTDQKIQKLRTELFKERRKKETEEMIQVSQIANRKTQ